MYIKISTFHFNRQKYTLKKDENTQQKHRRISHFHVAGILTGSAVVSGL